MSQDYPKLKIAGYHIMVHHDGIEHYLVGDGTANPNRAVALCVSTLEDADKLAKIHSQLAANVSSMFCYVTNYTAVPIYVLDNPIVDGHYLQTSVMTGDLGNRQHHIFTTKEEFIQFAKNEEIADMSKFLEAI